MFTRTSFAFIVVFAWFIVHATAIPGGAPPPTTVTVTQTTTSTATNAPGNSECSTGPIQCCNSVQKASSPLVSLLSGLLGVVLGDLNIPVGVTCSPITVIGVSGTSCTAQTVCCQNNSFNGVIAIGCTPININL